jgi:hypothetical protein
MKILFTLLICAFAFTSFGQDFENAGQYMDYISKQQQSVSKKFLAYSSAVAHGKRAKKVENLRTKLLDEVQESRMNIGSMGTYKGDKSYRDSAVNFLKFYFTVLNEDYSKIINLEEVAEKSYDDMEAYIMAQELVDKKLEEENAKIKKASADFAKKNNINLIEDKSEIGQMLEKVGDVNEYYRKIYLLFFKANIQETNLLAALEKKNITGIEQSKSALLKYAQEGLTNIEAIKAFDGDNSLTTSFKNMMNFYVKEVNGGMKTISDFFLTKERFDALQKELDKKGSNRTKEDVDNYNKGVKEINAASEKYNKTNKELFEMRKEALNDWNKAVNDFFDTHIPKYK